MSENIAPETAQDDRAIGAQIEKVSGLLQELEKMVDPTQHAILTDLLAERAVLSAMRARVELEEMQKRKAPSSSTSADPGQAQSLTTEGDAAKATEAAWNSADTTKGAN